MKHRLHLFTLLLMISSLSAGAQPWSERMAETVMHFWPDSMAMKPGICNNALRPGMIELGDGRPRNGDGQFVANETGGADPNSMAAAYGPGAIQRGPGFGALAASGGVGAGGSIAGTLAEPKVKGFQAS